MNEALLFLHFVGRMLGAAGGFASAVIMRRALALPADELKVVRSLASSASRLGHQLRMEPILGQGVMGMVVSPAI